MMGGHPPRPTAADRERRELGAGLGSGVRAPAGADRASEPGEHRELRAARRAAGRTRPDVPRGRAVERRVACSYPADHRGAGQSGRCRCTGLAAGPGVPRGRLEPLDGVRFTVPEEPERVLRGHGGSTIWALHPAVAPDGRMLLASASQDETARVWDPATGEQLARLNCRGPVESAAWDSARR